jgi:hypothetical protein
MEIILIVLLIVGFVSLAFGGAVFSILKRRENKRAKLYGILTFVLSFILIFLFLVYTFYSLAPSRC